MEIVMKDCNLESFKDKDIYTWEEILNKIADLEFDKKMLEEELQDLKNDVENNYKIIENDPYEEYGLVEEMFH